jgi:exodeoxyribonuclease V gamma subunit
VIQFSNLSEVINTNPKVIFLLGLDEDSFPRKKIVRSLNELKGCVGADHLPENAEKDRFYFLEAILSAKEKLIISYTGLSETDGKPLAASLCVQELIRNFTSNPIQKHPSLSFYPKPKQEFTLSLAKAVETPLEIDIRHLIELTKHPIRFYCNRILGIFLEKPVEKESREFFLSYLDKSLAKEAYLKQSEDELFESWEKKNLLPTALFKESAKLELLEELKELHLGFKNFELEKNDFFSIYFDPACKEPTFLDNSRFIHPAIQITLDDGKTFTLSGKLPNLSKKGIYLHKNFSLAELWKHLPHLAILNKIDSPAKPLLLFGKDFLTKTSPFPLTTLIEYYLEASKAPSPLLPDQIEKLLKKKLFSPVSFFDDPYLTFLSPDLTKDWDKWLSNLN